MNFSNLTNEDKKRISNERQNAVRNAWKLEKDRVANGNGTRNWSKEQQKELLERGSVKGFEGHHMKSVSVYPEYASDPKNIQFLTETEHLYGAHQGNYHNLTNGYYNPETKQMIDSGDKMAEVPEISLQSSSSALNCEESALQNVIKAEYTESENVCEEPLETGTVESLNTLSITDNEVER